MIRKDLTFYEIQKFEDRHGFLFKSKTGVYDHEKIKSMCLDLIDFGITEHLPEFYSIVEDALFVVYPENIQFSSGEFYQKASQLGQATGLWGVDTLHAVIKNL
jgi:hypothetical protein